MLVMYAHAPAKNLAEHVDVSRKIEDELLPSIAHIPGVEASAAVMGLPTGAYDSSGRYEVAGISAKAEANFSLSSPKYFATLRVPLLLGRDFTARDNPDSPGVAIVSESLVRQTFHGENPLGRLVTSGLDNVTAKPMTIVGVVGDVRQNTPGAPPDPTIYMPLRQHPFRANEVQIVVRTSGPPSALTGAVRNLAHTFNPAMAVKFTTLDDMVADSVSAPRFQTFVATTFGALALLLAMAGIYGVMSYMVSQRTQELGLRMALGAATTDVIRLVMSKAAALALLGLIAGTILSLASAKLIGSLLFGLTATDPSTYLLVFLAVGGIAALAAAGPALRAARIDPMVALRDE